MYNEILESLEEQLSVDDINLLKTKLWHLGIFTEPFLTYMLDGEKTIESRFSKNRILPYNNINKDDIVFVKKSSGDVLAYFTIKEVMFFDFNKDNIDDIKFKYAKQLCVDDSFWIKKRNSNYATLIFIKKLVKIKPFHISKKGMQTWIKISAD